MKHPPNYVLVIEDNPGDADLVKLRLVESKSDVDVSCVTRLADGLRSLGQEPPSVVLLDLNLPDSYGADTFRRVLTQAPGVPVVVLSGQDDEELAVKAVHQGVQDYLVKGDFDSKQLARAIRYAVERQSLLTSLEISRKQQLQFKDQFLSHVSHELRTPLTCIHQFVTILLDELAGPLALEQREHLETILRSANQLHTMIADLLEATRAESGKTNIEQRCIAIGDVITQATSMLQASAQVKKVALEWTLDDHIPLVFADPDRVLQVLTNLIHNAIKFTPANGSITVRAYRTDTDPDFVYVSVKDTGQGISPEAKALIFERLFQDSNATDNSRKGLGLGLYIAKELIHLHGGRLWVESAMGHGSVFSFTLPLFSMTKLLSPVLIHNGKLREQASLLTVELTPRLVPLAINLRDIREQCLEVLRRCIFVDKDIVLPPLGTGRSGETFLIVASADKHGSEILSRRISQQLERNPQLQSAATFTLSAVPIQLPQVTDGVPVLKLMDQAADRISEMVMATLNRKATYSHSMVPAESRLGGEKANGQAKNSNC